MLADALAYIDQGLADGLSPEALLAAAQARIARPVSEPTLPPPAADDTLSWLEGDRGDD